MGTKGWKVKICGLNKKEKEKEKKKKRKKETCVVEKAGEKRERAIDH